VGHGRCFLHPSTAVEQIDGGFRWDGGWMRGPDGSLPLTAVLFYPLHKLKGHAVRRLSAQRVPPIRSALAEGSVTGGCMGHRLVGSYALS